MTAASILFELLLEEFRRVLLGEDNDNPVEKERQHGKKIPFRRATDTTKVGGLPIRHP